METSTSNFESKADALKDGGGAPGYNLVKMWIAAIDASTKEEKDWREDAEKCLKIYRAEEATESQTFFNILHSNTETILPATYNSTPVPDIRRRFNDPGYEAKQVADILERAISYSLDSYDFDGHMRAVLFDSYVAGRGVSRVRYVPYFTGPEEASEGEGGAPEAEPEHGDGTEPVEPGETVAYEEVVCEYVPWKSFRRGPGRVWDDVPWVAFEHFLSREQLTDMNPTAGALVDLDAVVSGHNETQGTDRYTGTDKPPQSEIFGRARVWEIWDKDSKAVLFIAPGWEKEPLQKVDDPLKLQGFFPIPRPVQPLATPGNLVPMTPYKAYIKLAEELNDITMRIRRLVRQLRVRGIYAGPAQSLEGVMSADDGELVPAPGLEAFIDGGGLEKAIAWWPLDPAVNALKQLYEQREQVKQTIYEVTGLSDILRGNTMASETATAQQIKSQWGSLRIQRMQADVARFARDLFRMKAEIISTRFSSQQLMMMTGVQITPQVEQILRSDLLRAYKIDIESDSTIRADLTRDKREVSEFIQGTAAFVQAVGPAILDGVIPKELALSIFASFARLQRLGKSAEDAIDRAEEVARGEAQNPPPQKPDPAMAKVQADTQLAQQKAQSEQQIQAAKLQGDMQVESAKLQIEDKKADLEHQREIMRMEKEFELKAQQMQAEHSLKRDMASADMQMTHERHAMDTQMAAEKHQNDIAVSREKVVSDAKLGREKLMMDYNAKKKEGGDPSQEVEFSDPLAELASAMKDLASKESETVQTMQQVVKMLAAPKKVVRDANNRVVGLTHDAGKMN